MTIRRPVWLLDVDGVLNANRAGWGRPPHSGYARAGGVEYRMRWSPDLTACIRLAHARGSVEILWATTWVDHITEIERLMGLPSMPTAFTLIGDEAAGEAKSRKRTAALDLVTAGRRLIWTDDDAFTSWEPATVMAEQGHLLIAPSPSRGLRREDWERIETFIGAVPTRVATQDVEGGR